MGDSEVQTEGFKNGLNMNEWVKIYRSKTGCCLTTAISAWKHNDPLPNTPPYLKGIGYRDGMSKIEWVKSYRTLTGSTLKEAVDAYNNGIKMPGSVQDKASTHLVKIPQTPDEAEAMIRVGYLWLKTNAPERLV